MREDDKALVAFIYDNGGQAYESELRKKFLQPRTTMWRAVKRLEREGIVEIQKKDLQNHCRKLLIVLYWIFCPNSSVGRAAHS